MMHTTCVWWVLVLVIPLWHKSCKPDPLPQKREGPGELCIYALSHWNAISQMTPLTFSLEYICCEGCTLSERSSLRVFTALSSRKDVPALCRHHVTRYCNMIGLHHTVRRETDCIRSHQTLPFFVEVGLPCETTLTCAIKDLMGGGAMQICGVHKHKHSSYWKQLVVSRASLTMHRVLKHTEKI